MVPSNTDVFLAKFMTVEKADLSLRNSGIQEEKLQTTTHFSKIIRQKL